MVIDLYYLYRRSLKRLNIAALYFLRIFLWIPAKLLRKIGRNLPAIGLRQPAEVLTERHWMSWAWASAFMVITLFPFWSGELFYRSALIIWSSYTYSNLALIGGVAGLITALASKLLIWAFSDRSLDGRVTYNYWLLLGWLCGYGGVLQGILCLMSELPGYNIGYREALMVGLLFGGLVTSLMILCFLLGLLFLVIITGLVARCLGQVGLRPALASLEVMLENGRFGMTDRYLHRTLEYIWWLHCYMPIWIQRRAVADKILGGQQKQARKIFIYLRYLLQAGQFSEAHRWFSEIRKLPIKTMLASTATIPDPPQCGSDATIWTQLAAFLTPWASPRFRGPKWLHLLAGAIGFLVFIFEGVPVLKASVMCLFAMVSGAAV